MNKEAIRGKSVGFMLSSGAGSCIFPWLAGGPGLHSGGWCHHLSPQSQPPGILTSHPPLHPASFLATLEASTQVAVMSVTSQRQGPAWFGVVHLTSELPAAPSCRQPYLANRITQHAAFLTCIAYPASNWPTIASKWMLSCLLPCPVLHCNAQHSLLVATIHAHSHALDHCLNNAPS